jgi:hypothetical protein
VAKQEELGLVEWGLLLALGYCAWAWLQSRQAPPVIVLAMPARDGSPLPFQRTPAPEVRRMQSDEPAEWWRDPMTYDVEGKVY